ncbi:hypothetical protein RS130_06620 [Paraglaciecola aquimarina]|uniref:Uncharacterized protein n=1 Tax=Paraglaciecola aquimarina TaxID=1235557 RepID=A0ABU3SUI6_9ALTE|nr:hypothetical protein [Paraglaciecola aquimarina]MDU0353647.1 hypothetical protein [Paraglaciecola aquimarina]
MNEEIRFERYQSAMEAIKDALFMYKTLLDYQYFFDDLSFEDGNFSPDIFIDCSAEEYSLEESDAQFLREASATKLICRLNQNLSENGSLIKSSKFVMLAKSILVENRCHYVPELGQIIRNIIDSQEYGEAIPEGSFKTYVIERFRDYLGLDEK